MEEREISLTPMFKWFTDRFGKKINKGKKIKKGKKTRLLQRKESKTAERELAEEPIADSVKDSVAEDDVSPTP